MGVLTRVKQSWNAFRANELDQSYAKESYNQGPASYGSAPPQRSRVTYYNERTIISSIYTRIGIDVAGILIKHIQLDDQGRYSDEVSSLLNLCLQLEPNIDQGPRAFRQDIVTTLFDKGVAAIVPVDTMKNPESSADFDILSLRVGDITSWYPKHVKVDLYNEAKGIREEINLEKRFVAIVENPMYAVMNESNSTLKRLIHKLHLLDVVDEQSSSGKLDIIIQLPYVIKTEARRLQAEKRRTDIEMQLKGSQYGIAYTDGTEKITQLNRPAENNLMNQIEFLTTMLYGQLGLTEEIMNGTADEAAMLNYHNRTIEPILDAIIEAMQRSFLGLMKTKGRQRIRYFREPFKFVTVAQLAEIADKFSRNEILSANEIRGYMGLPPSKDPKADQLLNSNMPQAPTTPPGPSFEDMDEIMNKTFDGISQDIDKLGKS